MPAGPGNDTLDGGKGADTLLGGLGDDVYIWNIGDGNDIIREFTIDTFDVLEFGHCINPEDITISRPDLAGLNGTPLNYLYLTYEPSGERITLPFQLHVDIGASPDRQLPTIEAIRFQDDTVWTFEYMLDTIINPTDGDDILLGLSQWDETLDGGTGNDEIHGFSGNDTYIFGRGYGEDAIFDNDGVSIFFSELNEIEFIDGLTLQDFNIERAIAPDDRGDLRPVTAFAIIGGGDVMAHATQIGSGWNQSTVFDFGNGDTLTLQSVSISELGENDFEL